MHLRVPKVEEDGPHENDLTSRASARNYDTLSSCSAVRLDGARHRWWRRDVRSELQPARHEHGFSCCGHEPRPSHDRWVRFVDDDRFRPTPGEAIHGSAIHRGTQHSLRGGPAAFRDGEHDRASAEEHKQRRLMDHVWELAVQSTRFERPRFAVAQRYVSRLRGQQYGQRHPLLPTLACGLDRTQRAVPGGAHIHRHTRARGGCVLAHGRSGGMLGRHESRTALLDKWRAELQRIGGASDGRDDVQFRRRTRRDDGADSLLRRDDDLDRKCSEHAAEFRKWNGACVAAGLGLGKLGGCHRPHHGHRAADDRGDVSRQRERSIRRGEPADELSRLMRSVARHVAGRDVAEHFHHGGKWEHRDGLARHHTAHRDGREKVRKRPHIRHTVRTRSASVAAGARAILRQRANRAEHKCRHRIAAVAASLRDSGQRRSRRRTAHSKRPELPQQRSRSDRVHTARFLRRRRDARGDARFANGHQHRWREAVGLAVRPHHARRRRRERRRARSAHWHSLRRRGFHKLRLRIPRLRRRAHRQYRLGEQGCAGRVFPSSG